MLERAMSIVVHLSPVVRQIGSAAGCLAAFLPAPRDRRVKIP
jgi:hypothetical protein